MISNRKNDMVVEREIASFLNENLYSNEDLFIEFARTDELDEQISGSDLLLSTKDGRLNRSIVDEKVAAKYANINLNTFSLELSFIGRDGKKRCGWLLDNTKKTEYYLFGWILSADIPLIGEKKYDTDKITKDNIKSLEWALVKKDDIINFLKDNGWTLEKLSRQDENIREKGFIKNYDFVDGVAFRYSKTILPEKPINVLLKKETYINISTLHGIIEK